MLNERVTASSADRLVRLVASTFSAAMPNEAVSAPSTSATDAMPSAISGVDAPALGRVGVVNARPSNEIIPSCSAAARPSGHLAARQLPELEPCLGHLRIDLRHGDIHAIGDLNVRDAREDVLAHLAPALPRLLLSHAGRRPHDGR